MFEGDVGDRVPDIEGDVGDGEGGVEGIEEVVQ